VTPAPETQPERTALAWQRTGLGVLAVAGLLAHRALDGGRAAGLAVAGVAALLGLGILGGLAPARYREVRRRLARGDGVSAPGPVAALTAAVVLVAVAAVLAVTAVPPG
jgi:putative membrane protein